MVGVPRPSPATIPAHSARARPFAASAISASRRAARSPPRPTTTAGKGQESNLTHIHVFIVV
eukprot:scaffold233582_cov31-Tisochrysis_lutea.AAC.1